MSGRKNDPTGRRSLDETRVVILDAACELLAEENFEPAAVTLIDACRRAGLRTAGSGYKIWPNQAEFRTDLMRHASVRRRDLSERLDRVGSYRKLDPASEDLSERIRVAAPQSRRSEAFALELRRQTAVWLRGHADPELRVGVVESELEMVSAVAETYRKVLVDYGLMMRAPYTVEHMAVAIEAQMRGLAMLTTFDDPFDTTDIERPTGPGGQPRRWDLLACVMEAIVEAFTEPV